LVDDGKGVIPTVANIIVIVIQHRYTLPKERDRVYEKKKGGWKKKVKKEKKLQGFFGHCPPFDLFFLSFQL
jgi:hypothetical protein